MAVGLMIEGPAGAGHDRYKAKVTPFVVASCVMAATGGLIFGYDIGISGGVTTMEPFLAKFFPEVKRKMERASTSNYCKFDSQLLTAFTSSLYLAGLVTTFFAAAVTQAWGRRVSMLLAGAAFLTGTALGAAAADIYMLIFGRVLLGVGVGFANQAVPLYLSEMAPPCYRGAFTNGFQICTSIGVLSANFVNIGTHKIEAGWGWRLSLALTAVPSSLILLGAIFLSDTPNSLIHRGAALDQVRALLCKIRGTPDVDAELDDLVAACSTPSEKSATHHRPLRSFVTDRKYRPQLTMAFAIPFFQQVTGINVIAFYAPVLYRTIGLGESSALIAAALGGGLVGLFATFASMLLVDRFGRRVLFAAGGVLMLASQLVVGGIMAARLGDHGGISKGYALLVLVLISVYIVGFGLSWGPLGWLVPSEIFPLEVRSAAQSVNVAVNFLFTFLVAQTFLAMLCHFKAGIFFFFGGWVAAMTLFVYLFLPETKGVPIEKMEQVWREHWFWKTVVVEPGTEKQVSTMG